MDYPTTDPRVCKVRTTGRFRLVDKSLIPQIYTEKVLQQLCKDNEDREEWVDVPFVGHVSDLEQPAKTAVAVKEV